MNCETLKIKPKHESQGDYVVINAEDFDESKHELLDNSASVDDVPIKKGKRNE
jgi:hypothetical protein